MRIPLFKPLIRETAVEAVAEVLRSGWLGLGPRTEQFETAFASYVGAPFCVGMNSCSSALHIALRLLNLPPGSEVITTPLTFVSTNHVILYEHCSPVFADVEPHTGNLALESAAERISERTRAIILVHYGGYPCDLDPFYALADKYDLAILEDCAHAAGAAYKGRKIGSHGDFHAFSFHPVKNLPMGDGGALTLSSADHDTRARQLRWLGIDADTFRRDKGSGYRWQYDVLEVGFKYHLNDVQAAIGLAQLPYLDEDNQRRSEIAQRYRRLLKDIPGLRCLEYQDDRTSSNHLFAVLADNRDDLAGKLAECGIDTGVHYLRNDGFRMYDRAELPAAEQFSSQVLSLPMHLYLQDEDVDLVAATIQSGW